MRFSFIASALALVASAIAQTSFGPNAFNESTAGTTVYNAGQSYTLNWGNKQGSTVTIYLRSGSSSDLKTVATIASNIANSGSFQWTPDTTLATGADYALEIVDDDDQSLVNYSGQFVIQSSVEAVASSSGATSLITITTPSAAASSTVAVSTTASAATSAATTGSATAMTSSATGSASHTGSATASHTSQAASSSAAASVPSNAAARPAAGAMSGLLLVAAGFAVAL